MQGMNKTEWHGILDENKSKFIDKPIRMLFSDDDFLWFLVGLSNEDFK